MLNVNDIDNNTILDIELGKYKTDDVIYCLLQERINLNIIIEELNDNIIGNNANNYNTQESYNNLITEFDSYMDATISDIKQNLCPDIDFFRDFQQRIHDLHAIVVTILETHD